MLSRLLSIICITLIVSSCSFTYPMAALRNAWQRGKVATQTQKPMGARRYTIPRPQMPNSLSAINSTSMLERFKTFSANMFDRAKNSFWQSIMNARMLTHGITESDVIHTIKNPDTKIDTKIDIFLNYLKDIDQEKANIFLNKLMLSNPKDNEIGFLSSVISNQTFNNKRNSDALEKLSDWMSRRLMDLLKLPNTYDIITNMITSVIGLDHKQKIGRQIMLNLSSICQTTTGRYLIKEIALFGTTLQKKEFKKYQREVGRTIFIIWSNIVNALKEDKKSLSLLEDVLKNETADRLLKIATTGEILEIATAIKTLEAPVVIDLSKLIAAKEILETETAKKLFKNATTEQIVDFSAAKQILIEIKKYEEMQQEKERAEVYRTSIE